MGGGALIEAIIDTCTVTNSIGSYSKPGDLSVVTFRLQRGKEQESWEESSTGKGREQASKEESSAGKGREQASREEYSMGKGKEQQAGKNIEREAAVNKQAGQNTV